MTKELLYLELEDNGLDELLLELKLAVSMYSFTSDKCPRIKELINILEKKK